MPDATVLIIDEHPDVCALLARRLGCQPGLKVVAHTSDPVVGAELARQWKPQIIMVDFKRAGRDRAEMYRGINRLSPGSRLVVLTSYWAQDEQEACLRSGASRCLLKGMRVKELARELLKVVAPEPKSERRNGQRRGLDSFGTETPA
jgi:DNA-binding NarL/FixJ family response regulator